ncbi:MAG: gluconokinase [Chthoniobacterales bacterium]
MSRRPASLVLAIDVGSSSLRTALFNDRGVRVQSSIACRKYSVCYQEDGGAELEAAALLQAARACLEETLRSRRKSPRLRKIPVVAVGGSGFWHSLLGLDRAGVPSTPVYMWADSRSSGDAVKLRAEHSERQIQRRTGCMLHAPFWPAKLRWLRRSRPAIWKRTAQWVSPTRWIFRELFGTDATSHSMASGTGLYDLRRARWDPQLCRICGVCPAQLGKLNDTEPAGRFAPNELRDAIILTVIGDGAASNLGSGADAPGRIAINVGTSAAAREIQPLTGRGSHQPPFGFFKYAVDEARAVLGGAISNGGNLHQWCLRELQLGKAVAEKALGREAAAADTLTVLPFWVSERAPTWPEDLRGTIVGLTAVTTAEEMIRAISTSTFYRLAEIVDALQPASGRAKEIIVSGGVLHSPASLAILADALGSDLRICRELESSLRGAALYALEKLGHRVTPLRPGRLVKSRPALARKHLRRRRAQIELERRLRATTR